MLSFSTSTSTLSKIFDELDLRLGTRDLTRSCISKAIEILGQNPTTRDVYEFFRLSKLRSIEFCYGSMKELNASKVDWSSTLKSFRICDPPKYIRGIPVINYYVAYSTEAIKAFAHKHTHIERVMFDELDTSSDEALTAFEPDKLKEINLGGRVTDGRVEAILSRYKHLERFNLEIRYADLTDKSAICIAERFPHQRVANWSWTQITERGLSHIIETSPQLQELRLINCKKINAKAIELITTQLSQTLNFLDLTHVDIRDNDLTQVGKCSNLQTLKISPGYKVTDKGLEALGQCSSLVHLFLGSGDQYTNNGVESLIKSCKQLQSITIPRFWNGLDLSCLTKKYPYLKIQKGRYWH